MGKISDELLSSLLGLKEAGNYRTSSREPTIYMLKRTPLWNDGANAPSICDFIISNYNHNQDKHNDTTNCKHGVAIRKDGKAITCVSTGISIWIFSSGVSNWICKHTLSSPGALNRDKKTYWQDVEAYLTEKHL